MYFFLFVLLNPMRERYFLRCAFRIDLFDVNQLVVSVIGFNTFWVI